MHTLHVSKVHAQNHLGQLILIDVTVLVLVDAGDFSVLWAVFEMWLNISGFIVESK